MPELKKPVDWDDLYQGRFLKAGQLGEKKWLLTIKSVSLDLLMDDTGADKEKGVMAFVETPKQITINKTNGTCLKAMFGRDVTTWVGKRIALFKGEWKGEPAIRIYGSPDIRQDITVVVKLPKRKPQTWVMHGPRRGETPTRAPQQAQEPAAPPATENEPPRTEGYQGTEPPVDDGPESGRSY